MRYTIEHESRNSIRLHAALTRMTEAEADTLEYYLKERLDVSIVSVNDRTGMVFIKARDIASRREALMRVLREFSFDDPEALSLVPENSGRTINRKYREKLLFTSLSRVMQILFLPDRIRFGWSIMKSLRFVLKGMKSILRGRVEVSVLDAIAIGVSLLRGDYNTAGSVMFLLDAGEILEEWTHEKSVNDLAGALSLNVDRVWLKTPEGEVLTDVKSVRAGDMIVVHTSNIIPLDGKVVSGEISVNQSSMTGESVPVVKQPGGYVYAGTVVEEGECIIEVKSASGRGKYDQIVRMIEESGKLKSESEQKAFHLADSLVPYALLGTGLTYFLTRNVSRAISFLMVDFSCALKLSMPLTVLSAIKEAGTHSISVKGGKFLEAVSNADTIVFDKTGTLTKARPKVEKIVTFNGADENEMLRIAACLEEHYPHSMANAVVKEAERRDLLHDEMHSRIEYVVAHGIASEIDGKKAIIGSYHFVFEDEECGISEEDRTVLESLDAGCSHLYLAVDRVLKAVICISDPLRKEAAEVIDLLRGLGINKICMMTGDNKDTAGRIASELNIDEYHAEVLPGDKAGFIKREHEAGRKVIMVGDGINDTPALSEADAGIAISDGAAIAREIADITISADELYELVTLKQISDAMMKRISANYRFIIGFNGMLIMLGVGGIISPATSAFLHNTSTIASGLYSLTPLLCKDKE
ncbi:MAG: heavy metal translocating P-type ATPase [Lachnospiraceae bacterium]|nr:heavy metal translocating P-type ATPase [Lachnospiraceae bacterium]